MPKNGYVPSFCFPLHEKLVQTYNILLSLEDYVQRISTNSAFAPYSVIFFELRFCQIQYN